MKVIEAISDTNVGGAGRLLLTRLKNSNTKEIQTEVILPKDSRLKERFDDIGVRTHCIDGCRDRSFDLSRCGIKIIPRCGAAVQP